MLPPLPDRAAYAQKAALPPLDFLELALQDEIDRREQKNMTNRVGRAGFSEEQTFEDFDWDVPVSFTHSAAYSPPICSSSMTSGSADSALSSPATSTRSSSSETGGRRPS